MDGSTAANPIIVDDEEQEENSAPTTTTTTTTTTATTTTTTTTTTTPESERPTEPARLLKSRPFGTRLENVPESVYMTLFR